jgi:hypothetical protein
LKGFKEGVQVFIESGVAAANSLIFPADDTLDKEALEEYGQVHPAPSAARIQTLRFTFSRK